jgi:hypothetical protein
MTGDLAAWLLEQIVEDERLVSVGECPCRHADLRGQGFFFSEVFTSPEGPLRILDECAAKRRIVGHLIEQYEFARQLPGSSLQSPDETAAWETCVRLLALPYADRDGYREEWRPDASAGV